MLTSVLFMNRPTRNEADVDLDNNFKLLNGTYAFLPQDSQEYPVYAYPKKLSNLLLLDLLLTRICRKYGLTFKRKFSWRRASFCGANLALLPAMTDICIKPYVEYEMYKGKEVFVKVIQFNGYLEFEYVSGEGRAFVIECYNVLKISSGE